MDTASVNEQVIADFRAGGEMSVEGMHRERLVLLTTVGEKTFEPSTVPVMFTSTDAGILVVASNDGADDDPQWYRNLVADPVVHVEEPTREYDGAARVLAQRVRDEAWKKLTADYPFFVDQQDRAGRELPLVEITKT
ncbi:MAG TPA: nitroreductase/quinone reductase family protein [Pseudolysinimonas sp.]|jgi:deazaflavin-dependent oxidoreductase (nitroreductase family)